MGEPRFARRTRVDALITLVTEIAKKMGAEESRDAELAQDVAPEKVFDKMGETERKLRRPPG